MHNLWALTVELVPKDRATWRSERSQLWWRCADQVVPVVWPWVLWRSLVSISFSMASFTAPHRYESAWEPFSFAQERQNRLFCLQPRALTDWLTQTGLGWTQRREKNIPGRGNSIPKGLETAPHLPGSGRESRGKGCLWRRLNATERKRTWNSCLLIDYWVPVTFP